MLVKSGRHAFSSPHGTLGRLGLRIATMSRFYPSRGGPWESSTRGTRRLKRQNQHVEVNPRVLEVVRLLVHVPVQRIPVIHLRVHVSVRRVLQPDADAGEELAVLRAGFVL